MFHGDLFVQGGDSVMFCSNCGKELADGAKFCGGCGKPVNVVPVAPAPEAAVAQESVAPVQPVAAPVTEEPKKKKKVDVY